MSSRKLRRILAPVLFPLSLVYRCVTSIRNKLYDLNILKSTEFDLPVISVGNITAGGTGKTPHVEYLLELLSGKFNLALLSRGYKRKTKGFILANENSDPSTIGDESFQIFKKFRNIKVAVDEKRVHGVRELLKKGKDLKCIVLDDAFQHRKIRPGVSILLIDYHRPLYKDFLLPMGDLREGRHGIHRANIVIVTKVPHEIKPIEKRIWIKELNLYPYQYLYFTSLKYGKLIPVYSQEQKQMSLHELDKSKQAILLVSGIGNPLPLSQKLEEHCSVLDKMPYADHYAYKESDLATIMNRFKHLAGEEKIVITTEKDAVKLRTLPVPENELKEKLYYLPMKISFLDNHGEEFNTNIHDFIDKNKRISRLHS